MHSWSDPDWEPAAAGPSGCRSTHGLGIRPGPHPTAYWNPTVADPSARIMPPAADLGTCAYSDTGPPNTGDVMSYTQPYWVDAYTYRAFAERIRTVSGYATARDATWASRRTVFGRPTPQGMSWSWGRGARHEGELGDGTATLRLPSGEVTTVATHTLLDGDGAVVGFSVALPPSVERRTAGGTAYAGRLSGVVQGLPYAIDLDRLLAP
jgi:hypothetical protein